MTRILALSLSWSWLVIVPLQAKSPAPAVPPATKTIPVPQVPNPTTTPDAEDSGEQADKPQNTDQLDEGQTNPLNPAGDSLDRLIHLRLNDDLWKAMLGDLPCLETQEACIKELQSLAVQNSKSLKAIDERVNIVNQKIDEARRNNQRTINLGIFEPAVQAYLKVDTITRSDGKTEQRGFFNKVLGIFTGISGVNELLSQIGIPLFRNLTGGDAAAQQRSIAITDLQVKIAEIEKQRGELADKIRETVMMQVLDFDVIRKDFQVGQEIAKREVIRQKLLKVDYRYSTEVSTNTYMASLTNLDRTKAESYRQWARLRSQLARIKLLVLSEND